MEAREKFDYNSQTNTTNRGFLFEIAKYREPKRKEQEEEEEKKRQRKKEKKMLYIYTHIYV